MQEQLLHFIWQHRYFAKGVLETTTGESLQIIKAGNLNTNQGPDFYRGRDYYWCYYISWQY